MLPKYETDDKIVLKPESFNKPGWNYIEYPHPQELKYFVIAGIKDKDNIFIGRGYDENLIKPDMISHFYFEPGEKMMVWNDGWRKGHKEESVFYCFMDEKYRSFNTLYQYAEPVREKESQSVQNIPTINSSHGIRIYDKIKDGDFQCDVCAEQPNCLNGGKDCPLKRGFVFAVRLQEKKKMTEREKFIGMFERAIGDVIESGNNILFGNNTLVFDDDGNFVGILDDS